MLKVKDLKVLVGKRCLVDVVDLSINSGEFIFLSGRSGSGKSQFCKSLLRLNTSSAVSGDLIFNTKSNITAMDENDLNALRGKDIAYIPQDAKSAFDPNKTIRYNIHEATKIHRKVDTQELNAICQNVLKKLNLDDRDDLLDAYPHQLSGGQLQRLLFGIALIHNPRLIIADEVDSSLDTENVNQVIATIKTYIKEHHATFIWVSHQIIDHGFDRYLIMHSGKIIGDFHSFEALTHTDDTIIKKILNASYQKKSWSIPQENLVQFDNINFGYGKELLLKNFALSVYKKSRIAVMGTSGSGKTTLMRLIASLIKPDAGVVSKSKTEIRVHMIFQQPFSSFNPRMTLMDSIKEAYTLGGKKFDHHHLDFYLSRLDIEKSILDQFPASLSGGELQKMALIRAMICDPDILILDEAFASLDAVSKYDLMHLIDEWYVTQDIALILVTHHRSIATNFCDQFVYM